MKRPPLSRCLCLILLFGLLGLEELSADTLRLMSYNIRRGFGMDDKYDLERTVAYLKEQNADLIALQEVDHGTKRSQDDKQPEILAERLGMSVAFAKFMDYDGGEYGLAVLAKPEILEQHTILMPKGKEPRVAQEVIVEVGGQRLSFVTLHLDYAQEELRLPQIEALLAALKDRKHPVVLAGDFNAPPQSGTMAAVAETFRIIPKSGDKNTYPANKPHIEIDFFAVRGLTPEQAGSCVVLPEAIVSDHRPLVMEIKLR